MMVATEITAASVPQPRKKNRNRNDTARFSHMAGRGTPHTGCSRPKTFGSVPFFCMPKIMRAVLAV